MFDHTLACCTHTLVVLLCVTAVVCLCVGVSLTLSTLIEGKTFNQGGHKIGLGLDFDA